MPDLKKPVSSLFAGGMANRAVETHLPENTAWDLVNLDITHDGTVRCRRGTQRLGTGHYHSLFAHPSLSFALVVKGRMLTRLEATLTEIPLVAVAGPVVFAAMNGQAHWSDGVARGIVTATAVQEWGLPVPASPTLVATASGGLDAGHYGVALTCRASNGEEGGALGMAEVDVLAGGGITLTALSETAYTRRVYLTSANGGQLFWHSDIPPGITTWAVGRTALGRPLETQFCAPPPPATALRYFQGRLLLAHGRALYWTRAMYPALVRPHTSFILFPHALTDLAPVAPGGVYVSTAGGETYFLAGADPYRWSLTRVAQAGIVRGTVVELLPEDVAGAMAMPVRAGWWGTDGIWRIGMPDGSILTPVDARFRAEAYTQGASARIQRADALQILTVGLH